MTNLLLHLLENPVGLLFIIVAFGLLLGKVPLGPVKIGGAGVLIAGLVFGHFGFVLPKAIQAIGIVFFVYAIGLKAGPRFLQAAKKAKRQIVVLSTLIVVIAGGLTVILRYVFDYPLEIMVGVYAGAMTSTPALAAAAEKLGNSNASIGYGLAYPLGVLGTIMMVQILPLMFRANLKKEDEAFRNASLLPAGAGKADAGDQDPVQESDVFSFSLGMTLGVLLGLIKIPISNGISISLGIAGGPLIAGLLFGYFGRFGKLTARLPLSVNLMIGELGLYLFLAVAGTSAGVRFMEVLQGPGAGLILCGLLITLCPILGAALVGRLLFKMNVLSILGMICGGMTSTPALGIISTRTKSDVPALAYTSIYPLAILLTTLMVQVIIIF